MSKHRPLYYNVPLMGGGENIVFPPQPQLYVTEVEDVYEHGCDKLEYGELICSQNLQ